MKVKELRNWLADLGEKNRQHYQQGHHNDLKKQSFVQQNTDYPNGDDMILTRKPSTAATSPSSSRDGTSPRDHNDLDDGSFFSNNQRREENDVHFGFETTAAEGNVKIESNAEEATAGPFQQLTLRSKNSTPELVEVPKQVADIETAVTDDTERTDELQQVESWDSDQFGSWSNEDVIYDGESYDDAPYNGRQSEAPTKYFGQGEDYFRRNTFGGIQGVDSMGLEHVTLLARQTTAFQQAMMEQQADEETSAESVRGHPSDAHMMHNVNLFGNKTLTSKTLDFICNDMKEGTAASLVPKGDDGFTDSSDDGSSYRSSSDDSSKPSLAPGALESKVCKMLLTQDPFQNQVPNVERNKTARLVDTFNSKTAREQPIQRPVLRKKLNPADLPFLQQQQSQQSRTVTKPDVVPIKKTRKSGVNDGILKFGGPRKTIVSQRKEALQKLWAENKEAVHVKKIKWGVCQKTGTYKKKVVVDVQYKK